MPDEEADQLGADGDAETLESAHEAVAGLALLPLSTSSLPDLLADVERLATTAIPGAGQVTLLLDGQAGGHVETARGGPPAGAAPVDFPLHAHGSRIGVLRVHRTRPWRSPGATAALRLGQR